MKSFSIRGAKDNFPALVRAAQDGQTAIITNRAKRVAKIAPLEEEEPVAKIAPLQVEELQDERSECSDLPTTFEQALLSLPHYLDF